MFIPCQNSDLKDLECNEMVAKHILHMYMTLVDIYSLRTMEKTAFKLPKVYNAMWSFQIK